MFDKEIQRLREPIKTVKKPTKKPTKKTKASPKPKVKKEVVKKQPPTSQQIALELLQKAQPSEITIKDKLDNLKFDPLLELFYLYKLGKLNDGTKVKMLLELMQYVEPKKKAVEMNVNGQVGTDVVIYNQINYTEEAIQ